MSTTSPQLRPGRMALYLVRYTDIGFIKRSGKGDHVVFTMGRTTLSVDYRRPYLLAVYVRRALALIAEEAADDEGN